MPTDVTTDIAGDGFDGCFERSPEADVAGDSTSIRFMAKRPCDLWSGFR